jgi:5-methylcytosine-specific restriction enzyme B
MLDPVMKNSEPMRNNCRGTLFALTGDESQYLLSLLQENDPELSNYYTTGEGVGYLTWLTFHPSYNYEDFVEGFRPVETTSGGLTLRLEDGIFKRICREAHAHPKQNYLLLIDEINRANLAKVFGELITLLEKDKRGIVVTLPQSKESFSVPPNVFILGTMNTADRSIKLLDAALRRRFAFLELMPDTSLLREARVNNLLLDEFLEYLNNRIAANEGREKQIGHAYLLDQGLPISQPDEFARRFRQEILPLLQEYCYEDYATLAKYLGDQIVQSDTQELNEEVLQDDDKLIEALTALIGK